EFRKRLTDEERRLAEHRAAGRGWADIAAECGGSPEALRKQLARGIDRVGQELGLDNFPHHEPVKPYRPPSVGPARTLAAWRLRAGRGLSGPLPHTPGSP